MDEVRQTYISKNKLLSEIVDKISVEVEERVHREVVNTIGAELAKIRIRTFMFDLRNDSVLPINISNSIWDKNQPRILTTVKSNIEDGVYYDVMENLWRKLMD